MSTPAPRTAAPVAPPPATTRRPASTAPASTGPLWSRAVPKFEPPSIVVNAVEGWGKTSLAAFAPSPLIVMAPGEAGYRTLLGAGSVPVADVAEPQTWTDLLALVREMVDTDTGHKTIVLDALGGIERLCHEHVCRKDFNGNWGESGFMSFGKGPKLAISEWNRLLASLDELREKRGVMVIVLSHSTVKTHKNPMGADFDQYIAAVDGKTWDATARWTDAILFGKFETIVDAVDRSSKKGKGIGGTDRVLYTEQRDAFVAKNRYSLPDRIDIPNDPQQAWALLWSLITNNGERNAS